MKLKTLLAAALLVPSLALAAEKPAKALTTLTTGSYTASIKAMPCAGCAGIVEETLAKTPGIEKVALNKEKKTVSFSVKKGVVVPLDKLQSTLKAASDEMGMGADYRLENIK